MNDEKINSMIQTPLTINQYFFEKNIDKINVTFEREEDMLLLLLNIFYMILFKIIILTIL